MRVGGRSSRRALAIEKAVALRQLPPRWTTFFESAGSAYDSVARLAVHSETFPPSPNTPER